MDITVSTGGSMNGAIMLQWAKTCFSKRGNSIMQQKSLLLMDSYGSHFKPEALNYLNKTCKTTVLAIPPKTTSILQPLDVSVNHPFKDAMRAAWSEWFEKTTPEFTTNGYRKRPSYQNLVDFVSCATNKVNTEVVKRAFECCGIGGFGQRVAVVKLNLKLRNIMEEGPNLVGSGSRMMLSEENDDGDNETENLADNNLGSEFVNNGEGTSEIRGEINEETSEESDSIEHDTDDELSFASDESVFLGFQSEDDDA